MGESGACLITQSPPPFVGLFTFADIEILTKKRILVNNCLRSAWVISKFDMIKRIDD
jgi:hypothetical protein